MNLFLKRTTESEMSLKEANYINYGQKNIRKASTAKKKNKTHDILTRNR